MRQLTSVTKRQAILILGMHRSGTSAVAGVLSALGVAGPKTLMGPTLDNPRGYFESVRLAGAFDKMLTAAGTRWHDWRQIDSRWFCSTAAKEHRQEIKALLIDEFGDEPLIFIKDPRICRFVPLITSILADLHICPVAIIPIRNPLEVACSLKRRNNFVLPKSALLWLRHTLDAEFQSRSMPRYFLSYGQFTKDWRFHVERAASQIDVTWPDLSDRSAAFINWFLTTDLHHERASLDGIRNHPDVAPLVHDASITLATIVAEGESEQLLGQLDMMRSTFNEGCRIFGGVVAAEEVAAFNSMVSERDTLAAAHNMLIREHDVLVRERDKLAAHHVAFEKTIDELTAERDFLAGENGELTKQRDAMLASRSWRLTAPLRHLRKLIER